MNLPNKLTIARVIAVPFFIAAYMTGYNLVAFVLFIAASFTDMLDGKIARKYHLVTNFGKIMDPLADKVLVYSAFCLMVEDGTVPGWMLIVILAREFVVAGMRFVGGSSQQHGRTSVLLRLSWRSFSMGLFNYDGILRCGVCFKE